MQKPSAETSTAADCIKILFRKFMNKRLYRNRYTVKHLIKKFRLFDKWAKYYLHLRAEVMRVQFFLFIAAWHIAKPRLQYYELKKSSWNWRILMDLTIGNRGDNTIQLKADRLGAWESLRAVLLLYGKFFSKALGGALKSGTFFP